jgi:hypothetical protein
MTEEEARTKWCPFARVCTDTHAGSFNRYTQGEAEGGPSNCIASACMAWRTYVTERADDGTPTAREGYCGLAGAPN